MSRVTGIGGIFFKAKDPARLRDWYRTHLGIEATAEGGADFPWRELDTPDQIGRTVWSVFPDTTPVDDRVEESEYGRFGWIMDPEGNRIELWEPPAGWPGR